MIDIAARRGAWPADPSGALSDSAPGVPLKGASTGVTGTPASMVVQNGAR